MAAGLVFVEMQAPLKVSEQRLPVKEAAISTTFLWGSNLDMELRGRELPGPWPIPPVRTPLEIQASLLDSDVHWLCGTEELSGD